MCIAPIQTKKGIQAMTKPLYDVPTMCGIMAVSYTHLTLPTSDLV